MQRIAIAVGVGLSVAGAASGQSLYMSYTVSDLGGGMYRYDFELLPNAGWEPGMAWRGVVWGDCASCPTPLTDFVGDPMSLPVGPWTEYSTISGEHNGPTFGERNLWWEPGLYERLQWSGVSTADLATGELLFSALEGRGGASAVEYEVAVRHGDCYADCDGNGELDVFDFLCFLNAFAAFDSWTDCEPSGHIDYFDFLCFMNEFAYGCP